MRLATIALSFLLANAALAADKPVLTLYYTDRDANLAQLLGGENVALSTSPTVQDLQHAGALLLTRDAVTDIGVANLGDARQRLVRMTLTAQMGDAKSVQDAYNGTAGSQVFYVYFVKPKDETQLAVLQQLADGWYSAATQEALVQAGYTRLPVTFIQENRVTLGAAKPMYVQGYR